MARVLAVTEFGDLRIFFWEHSNIIHTHVMTTAKDFSSNPLTNTHFDKCVEIFSVFERSRAPCMSIISIGGRLSKKIKANSNLVQISYPLF